MLNSIIRFSLRNKLIIGLFTIGLIIFGIYEATRLPIDAQPDITNNQVQVITVAPSFGAADIERLVTIPIEQANSNISGVTEIRSFNRFGLSLVTIVFDDKTDVYWARQQVAERLTQVKDQIPDGIGNPELGPISTGLGEIFQYVVRAKKGYESQYNETELRTIQDWVIRRQLLGTQGVAEVSSFGGKLKQYEIAINPNKLQASGLNINDVFEALESNNQNTGGAYIEKAETVLFIRSEGLIGTLEDIESIAVRYTSSGNPVLIKDVAEVKFGYATRYGAMTYNDQGEVSGAIVMMLKGENANKVIKNIKTKLAEIEKTLPEGVVIEPFLDRAKMVNNTIKTIETNLVEGALIVVFILVLFLGNFRAGFLVASVIPLSMLFAVIMMNIFGVGGNLMSLGALDFGLIVDGAVIIVEAVLHQLTKHRYLGAIDRKGMDDQVYDSSTKMVNSAVFGQIIILVVYLPIFTLQGIEGKMFIPMAQTVVFALIGAFILSLTYVPMMSSLVLKLPTKESISDKYMAKIEAFHQKYLFKSLRYSKVILSIVLLLFAGAVFVLSRMGGEFVPSLEEGDFAVEMRILPGSNITTTIKETNKAANILLSQFPEVEKVVTKIGSAEIPTEPMPMDAGDMIVVLKPKKQWTSAKTFPELSEKMSKALEVLPGVTTGFQFPVQMRFNELMTGARQDVVVKIFGEDLDNLVKYAHQLGGIISKVSGAQDLYIEPLIGAPQVVIDYDRALLSRHKLSVAAVNRIVNSAFAGQSAGQVFEGERRFEVMVRMDSEQKKDLEDIRNLLIPTPSGTQIPLHQIAAVDYKSSPNQIQREDTRRRIIVGFNVRGRDVQSIVQELQQKVDKNIRLETGYSITYGGTFENLNQAKARLGVAVPISLALIFLLLFFSFKSVKYSLLIYTAIPLSAIGGIYFLALRGMPFSISAGVGFIALFGVAVLNGIVLVAEYNRIKLGEGLNPVQIVLKGTQVRLRPVLMTAFVASLGFLPMAISKGSGAEVQRPLATVVIGGLLFATFLTLFVLPILYVLVENFKKPNINKTAVLFLFIGFGASAQQPITLDEAINLALENSLQTKDAQLQSEYRNRLKASYLDIAPTQFSGEYGRLDGITADNRFGISQTFKLPAAYSKKKEVLHREWQQSIQNQNLTHAQIKKAVSEVFQHILVVQEKKNMLLKSDSLFQEFASLAHRKLQLGETNLLETSTANIQKEQIQTQLAALENDWLISLLEFQLLMNSKVPRVPSSNSSKIQLTTCCNPEEHPEINQILQQIETNKAETDWEKTKLLPEFLIGYSNQSLKDLNSDRFSSVQAGISLPIFTKSQKALIQSSLIKQTISENQLALKKIQLAQAYQQAMAEMNFLKSAVESYEQKQLPEVKTLQETAQKQLSAGEINFLDWVILTKQSLEIKTKYLETIELLNMSNIRLNYLITK
jgi:cobalt-zinc-cadmium resistance protein CzcA